MQFLALLLLLLFATAVFLALAFLLRRRRPRISRALLLVGGGIALLQFFIWLTGRAGWSRDGHYEQVVYSLRDSSYRDFLERTQEPEMVLQMLSLTSNGLYRAAKRDPELRTEVIPILQWMVRWVSDEHRFRQWVEPGAWDREVFMLAHAGIIIGHYQLLTLDETYGPRWQRIMRYVGGGLTRSRYKHLASRQRDEALRPYDNAAALYALRLYDAYYAEELAVPAIADWSRYVQQELLYADTRYPCAGFTTTNRCRLYPVASSLALLSGYSAEAETDIARGFWREYKHYYKKTFLGLSAWFRITPSGVETPEFCDDSVRPIPCGQYQNALSQWAAATRGDWLTYYQLHNYLFLGEIFGERVIAWRIPAQHRTRPMLRLAARLAAETEAAGY